MDIRTQTSLIAAVLSVAIAVTVLLRARRRRMHWFFSLFALSIALWHLTRFLDGISEATGWIRANLVCAVAVPIVGVQFFRAFIDEYTIRMAVMHRASWVLGITLGGLIAFTSLYDHIVVSTLVLAYLAVMLMAPLAVVYQRGRHAVSRAEGARLKYLALVGALATTFTIADYLPYVGLDIPPVGTVLTLVFLYVLSESILLYRLIDLYELAGRLAVLTALSFALAVIFWLSVQLAGGGFFLPSVVAAMVVLLLFDPVRAKVEDKISQFMFRERYDLERTTQRLRERIARVIELDDVTHVLIEGLESSRRITHAGIYYLDKDQRGFNLASHVGPAPASRLEIAPARPLFDRLRKDEHIVLEIIESELDEMRKSGETLEAETHYEIVQILEAINASVCISLRGDSGEIVGLLSLRDDRMRDAFTPEEISLFRGLANQVSIAIENTRVYERFKERDRLAALGEMAAGLAHEIRNPLGAIKASAQYMSDAPETEREFLDIIVDEVDRLNRVVSSFLDFARPSQGNPSETDVNAAIQRTMQILGPECQTANVVWALDLDDSLPAVRVDVEQLRQVIINLVRNALQAMETGGKISIATRLRDTHQVDGSVSSWAEMRVSDTGPGIAPNVLSTLFVPFVTTKDKGTGLGLSISHRIVTAAGGHIEAKSRDASGTVSSERGESGATFVVRFPVKRPSYSMSEPEAPAPFSEVASGAVPAGDSAKDTSANR